MRTKTLLCASIVATLLTAPVAAANYFDDGKDAINYRKGTFGLILHQFGIMKGMVKGKLPFDSKEFERRAVNIAALSKMPWEGFVKGSEEGHNTEALPALWENMDDFKAKAAEFEKRAAALAVAAGTGNQEMTRKAFGTMADSCKGCHKKYKD